MPTQNQTPRTAEHAAHLLAMQGKHVHVVSEGYPRCLPGTCPTPTAVD